MGRQLLPLHGLEQRTGLLQEAADSLAWAAAVLRHMARGLVDAEDGNAEQLELAWLCLAEAGELLMAGDRAAVDGRGAEV